MENNFIKWVKWITKYYIWAFGIMLAYLAAISHITAFPSGQLRMSILLCVFNAAWIIALGIDIFQKNRKKQ